MYQSNANAENDRGKDPDPDLHRSQAAAIKRWMQMIVDADQEEGHPAEQVQMRMRGKRRVICADGHCDAPDHPGDKDEHGSAETQNRSFHGYPRFFLVDSICARGRTKVQPAPTSKPFGERMRRRSALQ